MITVREVVEQLMAARDRRVLKGVELDDMIEPDAAWVTDRAVMLCFGTWNQDSGGYRLPAIVVTASAGLVHLFDMVLDPDRLAPVASRLGDLQDRINSALAFDVGLQPEVVRLSVALSLIECMDGQASAPGASTISDVVAYSAAEPGRKPITRTGLPQDADLAALGVLMQDYGFAVTLDSTRVQHWPDTLRRGLRVHAWLCYMIESEGRCHVYCGDRPHPEAEAVAGVHVLAKYGDHGVAPMAILAPSRDAALDRWHRWVGLSRGVSSSAQAAPADAHPVSRGAMRESRLGPETFPENALELQRGHDGFQLSDNGNVAAAGDWGTIRRYLLQHQRPAVFRDEAGRTHPIDPDEARAPSVR